MDPPRGPIEEPHVHLAEVVLGEFPRQALEAHERAGALGPQRLHQRVEGALAARVAGELRPPQ